MAKDGKLKIDEILSEFIDISNIDNIKNSIFLPEFQIEENKDIKLDNRFINDYLSLKEEIAKNNFSKQQLNGKDLHLLCMFKRYHDIEEIPEIEKEEVEEKIEEVKEEISESIPVVEEEVAETPKEKTEIQNIVEILNEKCETDEIIKDSELIKLLTPIVDDLSWIYRKYALNTLNFEGVNYQFQRVIFRAGYMIFKKEN